MSVIGLKTIFTIETLYLPTISQIHRITKNMGEK